MKTMQRMAVIVGVKAKELEVYKNSTQRQ